MSDTEIETAVAAYTAELLAEAELGRAEVVELEDHLRTLIGELREHGLPAGAAITEAARRLGDPRSVAREHARVRSAFGARLSKARTSSVIALLVPLVASGIANVHWMSPLHKMELAATVVLAFAMALHRTWARPILLGGVAFWTCWYGSMLLIGGDAITAAWLVVHGGLVAFLVPWRRRELTTAGMALALQVWAFSTATFALGFAYTTRRGGEWMLAAPAAQVALVAAAIATLGGVMRARWSGLAAGLSTGTLAIAMFELVGLRFRAGGHAFEVGTVALMGSGVLAAAVATVLAWRTARSRFGSLRALVS